MTQGTQTTGTAEVQHMVKDPVCGMEVDPDQAAGQSFFKGQNWYFCSDDCKEEFDADPWAFSGD